MHTIPEFIKLSLTICTRDMYLLHEQETSMYCKEKPGGGGDVGCGLEVGWIVGVSVVDGVGVIESEEVGVVEGVGVVSKDMDDIALNVNLRKA